MLPCLCVKCLGEGFGGSRGRHPPDEECVFFRVLCFGGRGGRDIFGLQLSQTAAYKCTCVYVF